MEYIETTIGSLLKYSEYLANSIKKNITESIEREDMLKSFTISNKIIFLLFTKFKLIERKRTDKAVILPFIEQLLNELYCVLRKINFSLTDYITGSYFSQERNLKLFRESCVRNEIFLRELYSDLQDATYNENSINKDDLTTLDESTKFLLKINFQKSISNTVEFIFTNLTQFKDEVYYFKTSDIFGYFYFYRTAEGVWFWSPPKKTDPEDIWIQSPEIKIENGYWQGKSIPEEIVQFVLWLDIFHPNIPEFYLKKKRVLINNPSTEEQKVDNFLQNLSDLDEKMKGNKCIIY